MDPQMQIAKDGAIVLRAVAGELLTRMFLECLSRGMTLPYTVCYVGAKASASMTRLSNFNRSMEVLFKTSERIELPINVMIVDWLGHSLNATVVQEDQELHVIYGDGDDER